MAATRAPQDPGDTAAAAPPPAPSGGAGRRRREQPPDVSPEVTAKAGRAHRSSYFTRARARAAGMLDDPDTLRTLAADALASGAVASQAFAGVVEDFLTLVRLVVAYARGHYREISGENLVIVVGALLYVVNPLDLIPDAIPVVGYLDDVSVVVWAAKKVRRELDAFREWELGQDAAGS